MQSLVAKELLPLTRYSQKAFTGSFVTREGEKLKWND